MRHGHEYAGSDSEAAPRVRRPSPQGALRPGETRRRLVRSGARVPLLDTDESSASDSPPARSPPPARPSPPPTDRAPRADHWWRMPRAPRRPPARDAIDRTLTRAGRERRPAAPAERRAAAGVDVGSHAVLFGGRRASRRPQHVERRVWVAPAEPAAAAAAARPAGRAPGQTTLPTYLRAGVPPELQDQLAAAASYEGIENVRLDFGIVPPAVGTRFGAHTYLGRGRLHALLHGRVDAPPAASVLGERLDGAMGVDAAGDVLARVLDRVCAGEPGAEALHFFAQWFGWTVHAGAEPTRALSLLLEGAQSALERVDGDAAVHLLWFRVDVLWRWHVGGGGCAADVLAHAQPLVAALAAHMHHAVTSSGVREGAAAEAWVCVMHVLGALDAHAFWDVLDAALDEWHAARAPHPVVWAEAVWYVLSGVCALAHFGAAAGVAASVPALGAHWPAVERVLDALPLRFDARVERAAPRAALRRRDAYIRILVRRCGAFAERWGWDLALADGVVARLFDVFDAHRLADLPTETDHDFAPFLRRFDAAALADGETGFHLYLGLLSRAGGAHAARLFSRVTPVRVMPFSPAAVPTAAERAMLYNHYSAVMLFLYVVPASAPQRLRQIRSFLTFARADAASRVACIRAMMYAGVLLRHHALDIAPVAQWFCEVRDVLLGEHAAGGMRADEALRTLAVVLRSVAHVITHAALRPGARGYPPLALVRAACDARILALAPAAAAEALGCVDAFLRARKHALEPRAAESPSSEMELDEALLHDPALGALLGEAPVRTDDDAFAEYAHAALSPALFQLLADSQHPDRTDDAHVEALVQRAEDELRTARLIDCWAGCAHVLVQHELRDWRAYFTLGKESWKRLGDPVGKRHVALRLAVNVALLDPSAYAALRLEFVAIWLQSLAADTPTLQAALTGLVLALDETPLFDAAAAVLGVPRTRLAPRAAAQRLDADAVWAARGQLVAAALASLDAPRAQQLPWADAAPDDMPLAVACVSALLSAVRAHVGAPHAPRAAREYAAFAQHVLHHVEGMCALVRRAVRTELHATRVCTG